MSPEPVVFTLAVPEPAGGRPKDAWSDLDMPAILSALADHGYWGADDQAPQLQKVVADAKADGHDLFVVAVDTSYGTFTVYRDIATQIQAETGGTVLVFGPGGVGTASSDFSRVELEDATSEISTGASASQAAREVYAKATAPNVDWTLVTIGLIAVVVIGAVFARLAAVRRARSTATAGAADHVDTEPAAGVETGDDRPATPLT